MLLQVIHFVYRNMLPAWGVNGKPSIKFRLKAEEMHELEKKKDHLAAQASKLQLVNGRLQLRFDMLYGICLATRQAASFLKTTHATQATLGGSGSPLDPYALAIASHLEQLISSETIGAADLLEDPFKCNCPPKPTPDIAPALVRSLTASESLGPSISLC